MLKISHQFPGGTIDAGDFRDRLARRFAAEVSQADQWRAEVRNLSRFVIDEDGGAILRSCAKGALDLSVYPLAYAGGEVPEVNIGLMPCLVTNLRTGIGLEERPRSARS